MNHLGEADQILEKELWGEEYAEDIIFDVWQKEALGDLLECSESCNDVEVAKLTEEFEAQPSFKTFKGPLEPLDKPEKKELKPSIEEPPILELKPLPSHLKYVYLGTDSTLPIVISNELSEEQEERLIQVLKEHKKAIG